LNEDERKSEDGMKLFEKGIEDMKLITRKYAKKQQKWILNRFIKSNYGEILDYVSPDSEYFLEKLIFFSVIFNIRIK
jgi:tRNA A37 N6-isopentenylltransferase MiaA